MLFLYFFNFLLFILGSPIPYFPRERGRREGAEAEYEKRDLSKSEWDTGVSVLWALKLDHLQPVKLILFQYFFNFLPFILGSPIPYYPRERKEGRGSGWIWEKGIPPKVNETQGFLTLGRSNWTICSLFSWFCSMKFSTFYPSYWGVQFLITPEEGRGRG